MKSLNIFLLIFMICSISCEKSVMEKIEVDPIQKEIREIVMLYCKWGERLLAQDYAGALSLVVPGSNGEGATKVAKKAWARGTQYYFNFTYVEDDVTEEDILKNEGSAKGNFDFIQSGNGSFVEFNQGFYSSCRKIYGEWKIEGFNSNLKQDWWGMRHNEEWPEICSR